MDDLLTKEQNMSKQGHLYFSTHSDSGQGDSLKKVNIENKAQLSYLYGK